MIRIALIGIFLFLFFVLSIPMFLIEWLIGKWNPSLKERSSLRIVQTAFKCIILISGAKVTVIGEENVPKDQAVLYIGNHRSFFDIVLTYARCPRLTGYVAKKELLKVPILRLWMKYLHCLFLDRKDVRQGLKTILEAIEKVKSGVSIMIFPEGTRGTGATEVDMLPFHEGSFKIATKSGCPIIPVAITNSSALFEDQFPKVRASQVIIEYGKPIDVTVLDRTEQKFLGKKVQEQIQEMLVKNRSALQTK